MTARSRVRRAVVLVGVLILVTPVAAQAAGPTLNGGGSSFAALEIDQWRAEVARKPYQLKINYVAQGSSFGRERFAAGTLDFGASDIPYQPADRKPSRGFAYVPISAGGIGFMYNLGGYKSLKLTRRAACRIFTEAGMRWNDPEIVRHNPGLSGESGEIRPVVRQDGSGTSYVLSEFCIALAKDVWTAFINRMKQTNPGSLSPEFTAGKPISNWPTGWGRVTSALAADGVAAAVADPSGRLSITYNEAGFAKVRGFPNAEVQNAAGVFTAPNEQAVTVALGYAVPNRPGGQEDGTFTLNYSGADRRAYFPSTYSYALAPTSGFPTDKGDVLSRFLGYAVTKGQEVAPALAYARLSSVLVDLALRQISKIPGFPGLEAVTVKGAAPPPPPPSVAAGTAEGAGGPGGGAGGGDAAGGGGPGGTGGTGGTDAAVAEGGGTDAAAESAADSLGDEAGAQEQALDAAERSALAGATGLSNRTILWLLLQGMALCAVGVFVAGQLAR